MRFLASLRNRIFLASTLVAILPLALAVRYVSGRVAQEAEAELRRGLGEAARRVAEHQRERLQTLTTVARLIADLPKLKAAVATQDPPTVLPLAEDYQARAGADVMIVTGRAGEILAVAGTKGLRTASREAVGRALAGREATSLEAGPGGLFQLVTVPIVVGPEPAEILGAASLGFRLDDAQAAHFKEAAGAEVAILFASRVWASSMPRRFDPLLAPPRAEAAAGGVVLDGEEYAVAQAALGAGAGEERAPLALVLRSRTASLRILNPLLTALLGAGAAALAVAVLLSLLLAQTVTRPLAALTERMREIARTGDLTPKREAEGRWDDEDARLLASSFQTLTGALARFQAEAAQRERLSALGRLSTVIAHEIRNPLMIVKAALRNVRRGGETQAETREAVAEIDHELGRIDRIVGDVLDYARPLRLQTAPTDLRALCRGAIAAATDGLRVELEVAPEASLVVTDADRLQAVLVNLLTNARDAVRAAGRAQEAPAAAGGEEPPDIRVSVRSESGDTIEVTVSDRGAGIAEEDLPHVFEPYVTGKRTGTGLGLAIARNVVEALGGGISAASTPGAGTTVRIRMPREARGAGGPSLGGAAAGTGEA